MKRALLLPAFLAGALLLLSLVIVLAGASPLKIALALYTGAFGNAYNRADTLVQTIPLLLTGLGVALAFRGKLFNIGAEGQFLLGAIAATALGTQKLPAPIHLPIVLCGGALAGAAWAGIAGILKRYRGVQEVLSTLLLNFVAIQIVAWMVMIGGPLGEAKKSFPQSDPVAIPARLLKILPGTSLHAGIFLAIFLSLCLWAYLKYTRGGFAIRAVGASPEAAEAAGIAPGSILLKTFLLSGALSGLAGAVQVSGVTYFLSDGYSPGYGYTAIAVALMANLHPLLIIVTALFFGALSAGSVSVQSAGISSVFLSILQAIALFTLLGYGYAKQKMGEKL
jgi:general nucleoside transport system permease protein